MTRNIASSIVFLVGLLLSHSNEAFSPVSPIARSSAAAQQSTKLHTSKSNPLLQDRINAVATTLISIGLLTTPLISTPLPTYAADTGASTAANSKITTGGASTLQSGRTITITRGVNLDNSNFKGQNLKGVAFQQSIVRDTDFRGTNLVGASFFDATLDGSNFEDAGMSYSFCLHLCTSFGE